MERHPRNYFLQDAPPPRANTLSGMERHPRNYFLQDVPPPRANTFSSSAWRVYQCHHAASVTAVGVLLPEEPRPPSRGERWAGPPRPGHIGVRARRNSHIAATWSARHRASWATAHIATRRAQSTPGSTCIARSSLHVPMCWTFVPRGVAAADDGREARGLGCIVDAAGGYGRTPSQPRRRRHSGLIRGYRGGAAPPRAGVARARASITTRGMRLGGPFYTRHTIPCVRKRARYKWYEPDAALLFRALLVQVQGRRPVGGCPRCHLP